MIELDNIQFVLTASGEFASLGKMEMPTMSKSVTTINPIHPGEILLEEFLTPLNLSANKFAKHIRVPANRISAIIRGNRGLSGDTALRLSKALDTTPEFWLNIQTQYDLEIAKDAAYEELELITKFAA